MTAAQKARFNSVQGNSVHKNEMDQVRTAAAMRRGAGY